MQHAITLDRDLLELRDEKKEVELFEHKVKVLRPEEF
jgi:predicted nucleic acid-binding protein